MHYPGPIELNKNSLKYFQMNWKISLFWFTDDTTGKKIKTLKKKKKKKKKNGKIFITTVFFSEIYVISHLDEINEGKEAIVEEKQRGKRGLCMRVVTAKDWSTPEGGRQLEI